MSSIKKYAGVLLASLALMFGAVFNASAALPEAAATAFTTLETDVLALIDLAWPTMIAITVAFIILRMFKRAASAAV